MENAFDDAPSHQSDTSNSQEDSTNLCFFIMIYIYNCMFCWFSFRLSINTASKAASAEWDMLEHRTTPPAQVSRTKDLCNSSLVLFYFYPTSGIHLCITWRERFQVQTRFSVPGVSCCYCWQWSVTEHTGEGSILLYLDYGRDKTRLCPHQHSSHRTFAIMSSCEKSFYVI